MKIRNGFVSNSSSSSFVVAFDKEPQNEKDVHKMMFNEEKFHYNPFNWSLDFEKNPEETEKYDAYEISCRIFEEIQKRKQATEEEMIESVANGLVDYSSTGLKKYEDKNGKVDWEKTNKEEYRLGKEKIKKFIEKNKNKVFYVFSFSDNKNEFDAMLEHTHIFKNLKHIQTSLH